MKRGSRRTLLARAALMTGLAMPMLSCGGPDLPPTVGAHALVYQRLESDDGRPTLSTVPLSTQPGSTLIVSVGRGAVSAFSLPYDSMVDIPFRQLGEAHTYTNWPRSGTALYALTSGPRGKRHVISASTPPADEITLAAVEVVGTRIQDFAWNEVLGGKPITSQKVVTTGPATLVAFWWGDAGSKGDKKAYPNNDFKLIDAVLDAGSLVQCAVAVKHVTAAGSYDVSWNSYPEQGAQLWIVAVQ